jgi:hypothetical protein
MSPFLVFDRVYRLEMLVFSTCFVNYCPSNLLSGYLSPTRPLPCVNKYTVYTYTVCGIMGSNEGEGVSDKTPPAKSLCRSIFFITSFGIAVYQSNLSRHWNESSSLNKTIAHQTKKIQFPFYIDKPPPPPPPPQRLTFCQRNMMTGIRFWD